MSISGGMANEHLNAAERASIVMGKEGSSNYMGKDPELDALLSAADRGMLDAIGDNLDLDTGFAQILDDLTAVTPAGRPTGPAQAEPSGHAHSHGHAPDPVLACEVSGRAPQDPGRPENPVKNRAITTRR